MSSFTEVKDSGTRQEWSTGSVRDTAEGKGRYDLIPAYPHKRLAQHFENGAKKYGDRNWEKGQPLMRYIDSAIRHLENLKAGLTDEDHASACVWNVYAYEDTERRIEAGELPTELDNRPWSKWAKWFVVEEPELGPCCYSVVNQTRCWSHPDGVPVSDPESYASLLFDKDGADFWWASAPQPELGPCCEVAANPDGPCPNHPHGVPTDYPDSYTALLVDAATADLYSRRAAR